MAEETRKIQHTRYVPFDIDTYVFYQNDGKAITPANVGGVHPFEYTNWIDEMMSWHDDCYIHAGLNPANIYRVKGPDALRFFSDICVNTFNNFPVGKGKHGIMCNEDGFIMQDGLLFREAEDSFLTFWMWPYCEYALQKGNYDAVGENLSDKMFMYQLGGPRSLEILETACGEDLHGIKFIHSQKTTIAGKSVNIVRLGMAGSLAYEVHGDTEDALDVYSAIVEAGKDYNLHRIGRHAYWNTHTECGFPQLLIHFLFGNDPDFMPFAMGLGIWGTKDIVLSGSAAENPVAYMRTPYDLGWGGMVNFDHEFVGKAALEKVKAEARTKMVTLLWDCEDFLDLYRSRFQEGEAYALPDFAEDWNPAIGASDLHVDKVLVGSKVVGYSSGRVYSPFYREMMSLCTIDSDVEEGAEVTIVYGNPGARQKEVRATVARFPYLNENRNENVDVKDIPHGKIGK